MKRWLARLCLGGLALALAGFLVAASGLVPIKASSGHWAVTKWFLRFSMERSTSTHSLGLEIPALDDAALVLQGATHYEIGCRSCHGIPGTPQPRVARGMTPAPPALLPRIQSSNPRQLFYVVKHGIKFTGMPAWPSPHRDDEVWAMVAFLLRLPEFSPEDYRRLVHGDPAPPPVRPVESTLEIPDTVIQSCARCHGDDGQGRAGGAFPRLAGQREVYLRSALAAYARGDRHSGIMEPIAAPLDEAAIAELARYYARLDPAPPSPPTEHAEASRERGRIIATAGIPHRRVPVCIECHDTSGRRAKPDYPVLAGQPARYLEQQLRLFKQRQRGGGPYAHLMHDHVAPYLHEDEMHDVAQYFASLPTEAGTAAAP